MILKLYVDDFNMVISTLNRLYVTGDRVIRMGGEGPQHTLVLTDISRGESPAQFLIKCER